MGIIKVEGTEEFITKLSFVEEYSSDLRNNGTNAVLTKCITELNEYFCGDRLTFTVPVAQNGTTFQQRVWYELSKITYGKTLTYLALAKRLGDAKCVRAAATSNGKNNVLIIVPCHRVIGSNRSLVGYAGGVWRKQWLLEHENKFANGLQKLF